jgi:hypothetical protein
VIAAHVYGKGVGLHGRLGLTLALGVDFRI